MKRQEHQEELEQLKATIENYKSQIEDLKKDEAKAYGSDKLQYTIQIQSMQVDLKEAELNLTANGVGLAVYAANPVEGAMAYAVSGARIRFAAIEDQAILDALLADARQGAMFYEIVEVLPLG